MAAPGDPSPPQSEARDRFFARLHQSLADGSFVRLVLARAQGSQLPPRVDVRRLLLRGEPHLAFVQRHATRDVQKNLPQDRGLAELDRQAGRAYRNVHLFVRGEELQLRFGKRGTCTLTSHRAAAEPVMAGHDEPKHRCVPLDRPFLADLGVATAAHALVPAMARKYRQIDKFVEIFAAALAASPLAAAKALRLADFGAGKGYLTFALHDWLQQRGVAAEFVAIERRQDLVDQGNERAERLGATGLRFVTGDVLGHAPGALDVLIALHACDTATDHALHLAIQGGASIVLCAPCCHQEVRPQLGAPAPLAPLLQHGIHCEQTAEMLTDTLRALALEAHGYRAQVFEFVSLEHTAKNKLILAVRQPGAREAGPVRQRIQALLDFYGVREQRLLQLLAGA